MRTSNEIRGVGNTAVQQLDQQKRDFDSYQLTVLNLRTKKSVNYAPLIENNAYLLSSETHTLGKELPGTRYDGVPGCKVNGSSFTEAVTTLDGIDFTAAIEISASASVIFNNCRFSNTVTITLGGRAHFIGCYFYSTGAVNNAGPAANAYIIGCVRKSGVAHVGVTIISETV